MLCRPSQVKVTQKITICNCAELYLGREVNAQIVYYEHVKKKRNNPHPLNVQKVHNEKLHWMLQAEGLRAIVTITTFKISSCNESYKNWEM